MSLKMIHSHEGLTLERQLQKLFKAPNFRDHLSW